jgi:hypothetical protein
LARVRSPMATCRSAWATRASVRVRSIAPRYQTSGDDRGR